MLTWVCWNIIYGDITDLNVLRHYFQCSVAVSVCLVGTSEGDILCCFTMGVVMRPACLCYPHPSSNIYISLIHLHIKRNYSLLKGGNFKCIMLESSWCLSVPTQLRDLSFACYYMFIPIYKGFIIFISYFWFMVLVITTFELLFNFVNLSRN